MPVLAFQRSSTPGHLVGEGEGRLLNCYVEKIGDKLVYRRVPGVVGVTPVSDQTSPRGIVDVDGVVYWVLNGEVRRVTPDGTSVGLGSVPGADGVTIARNNRVTSGTSTPDVVAVRESGGAALLTITAVLGYPDGDLPGNVNSISFLGGYFLFTVPDGRIFASELNSTDVNALSFATAESMPDGLLRGIAHASVFYAMGPNSIEPWINVGNSPFPLARATTVIPVGILTTMAVAGTEEGWDRNPFFVAHDGTVRELDGYDTRVVSTADVERFVAASTVSTIRAFVYTVAGQAIWCLSSDAGTWEYNVTTGQWHERVSTGLTGWRASMSVNSNGRWVLGDRLSGMMLTVSRSIFDDYGAALAMMIESGPLKEFPVRAAIPGVFADFSMGVGTVAHPNPTVAVSWSRDGGATWSTPVSRSLAPNVGPVRVNRLGLATHHGIRVRFVILDSVDVSFMGASIPAIEARTP